MQAQQKTAEKWKNKQWFNVYAPKLLGEGSIGEVPAADDNAVVGRVISVNLSWITQNPQHSFMSIVLKINEANGNVAHTVIKRLELVNSYVHSLTRKYSSVIYTVDRLADKNGKGIVLKLIAITRGRITTPKKKAIRKELQTYAKEYLSKADTDSFINDIIAGNFQSGGMNRVKNIAQLSRLEVRKVEF